MDQVISQLQPLSPKPKAKQQQQQRCIFAAVGDVHGQFSAMVDAIRAWERRRRRAGHGDDDDGDRRDGSTTVVDFVLQVGDLEPHRHERDLASMAMPSKRRTLGDFHRVFSGELPLPWPTYFIGGNHEPWEFLEQHEGAGFTLVPNLHFLGRSSVTTIGPLQLRVAALSGIDSANEFSYHQQRPHVSQFPYQSNKAYINFNHTEVIALVEEANLEYVRTVLSAKLGLRPRAIESISSPSGANVRCVDDLATVSDRTLKASGIMAGPREKIAAYQEQARTAKNGAAASNTGTGASSTETTTNMAAAPNQDPTIHTTTTATATTACGQDGLVDVLMTHDWPSGIADANARGEFDRVRPFGNDRCRMLLEELRPSLMLCGHMHQAHTAVVGPSAVRCLAKVPATGSVAFFEVLDGVDALDGSSSDHGDGGRRLVIRELT